MPRRDNAKRHTSLRPATARRVPKARANGKSKKTPAQIENPVVTFRLPLNERDDLDAIAAARGISRNALLREIVGQFIRKKTPCIQG